MSEQKKSILSALIRAVMLALGAVGLFSAGLVGTLGARVGQ